MTLLGYCIACYIFVEILKEVNYLHTRELQILQMVLRSGSILFKKGFRDQIEVKIGEFGFANIYEFAQKSRTMDSKKRSNVTHYKS